MSGGRGHLNCFMIQPSRPNSSSVYRSPQLARSLERADIDDAEHRRQDQRVAQRRERANCRLNR